MAIDVESLLNPISPDAPCGVDIGYDALYLELDVLIRGKPEVQMGSELRPAEEPDWNDIRERCLELFGRSKHLRVAVDLAAALLQLEGLPGLRDGLGLVRGLLERYWEDLHPKLDPEDNNDPTERMNIIGALAPPPAMTMDEFLRFRDRLLDAPLCVSRRLGRFGLRQILWMSGEIPVPAADRSKVPEAGYLQAAFDEAGLQATQAMEAVAAACVAHMGAIDAVLTQRVGAGGAPNLESFQKLLERVRLELQRQMARLGGAPVEGSVSPDDGGRREAPATTGGGGSGAITTPQDVVRTIDRLCDYYARAEPSSPVPLLLKRARRLVGKTFTQIIRDLSPDALHQIESISGTPAEPAAEGSPTPP